MAVPRLAIKTIAPRSPTINAPLAAKNPPIGANAPPAVKAAPILVITLNALPICPINVTMAKPPVTANAVAIAIPTSLIADINLSILALPLLTFSKNVLI